MMHMLRNQLKGTWKLLLSLRPDAHEGPHSRLQAARCEDELLGQERSWSEELPRPRTDSRGTAGKSKGKIYPMLPFRNPRDTELWDWAVRRPHAVSPLGLRNGAGPGAILQRIQTLLRGRAHTQPKGPRYWPSFSHARGALCARGPPHLLSTMAHRPWGH